MSRIERSDDRTYQDFLQQVTALVRQSRVGVARSVNRVDEPLKRMGLVWL